MDVRSQGGHDDLDSCDSEGSEVLSKLLVSGFQVLRFKDIEGTVYWASSPLLLMLFPARVSIMVWCV